MSLERGEDAPVEASPEVISRRAERKFNDYLSKVANSPGAPELPPAMSLGEMSNPPDSSGPTASGQASKAEPDKNDPYAKLKAEAVENPDAGRKSNPESYLSSVTQLPTN